VSVNKANPQTTRCPRLIQGCNCGSAYCKTQEAASRCERQMALAESILDDYGPAFRELAKR
jgi:hypothetical protein